MGSDGAGLRPSRLLMTLAALTMSANFFCVLSHRHSLSPLPTTAAYWQNSMGKLARFEN